MILRFILKRSNNLVGIFHVFIIAMFLLSLSGCGYKADPYYLEEAPKGDNNVEFIIKKPTNTNESNTTKQ
jgi:predicted small lipoprotein YifL